MKVSADTILLISDGLPRVRKGISQAQIAAHNEKRAAWHEANADRIAAWDAANAAAQVVEEKIWVPPQPARPAVPADRKSVV